MRKENRLFAQVKSYIEKFGPRRCLALLLAIVMTITSVKFDWWSIGSQADPNQPTYDAAEAEVNEAEFDDPSADQTADTGATAYDDASGATSSSDAVAASSLNGSSSDDIDDNDDYDDPDYDDYDDPDYDEDEDAYDSSDYDDYDDEDVSDSDDDDDDDYDTQDNEEDDEDTADYDDEDSGNSESMPSGNFIETTPEEDIHVTAKYGADTFPAGSRMKVENVTDKYVLDIINGRVAGITDIAAVKITFEDNEGDEVDPEKKLKVAINLGHPMNTDRLMLVHINDEEEAYQVGDDRIERLTEGNATFYADSFSVYAILALSGDNAITSTARNDVSTSYTDDDYDDEEGDDTTKKIEQTPNTQESPNTPELREEQNDE